MNVLLQINHFEAGKPPHKLLAKCAKLFRDFPPEKLPFEGDLLTLDFNYNISLSPVVRRRICMLWNNFPHDWVIQAQTNDPHLVGIAKRFGWDTDPWPVY